MGEREPPRRDLPPRPREPRTHGLCPGCRHVRRIESAKGAVFFLCERSREDARYPKYPPQPVFACPGWER